MQLKESNIFAVALKEFYFSTAEITPLIEEILKKEKQIKKISSLYSRHGGIGEGYYTDYGNPVKLVEYEKLMVMVGNLFANKNNNFNLNFYWSAFYSKYNLHDSHNHCSHFLEKPQHNYSSVLYLTQQGHTKFLSPNHCSIDEEIIIKSEVGKLIIFPSAMFHSGTSTEKGKRIIISSNLGIYRNE